MRRAHDTHKLREARHTSALPKCDHDLYLVDSNGNVVVRVCRPRALTETLRVHRVLNVGPLSRGISGTEEFTTALNNTGIAVLKVDSCQQNWETTNPPTRPTRHDEGESTAGAREEMTLDVAFLARHPG